MGRLVVCFCWRMGKSKKENKKGSKKNSKKGAKGKKKNSKKASKKGSKTSKKGAKGNKKRGKGQAEARRKHASEVSKEVLANAGAIEGTGVPMKKDDAEDFLRHIGEDDLDYDIAIAFKSKHATSDKKVQVCAYFDDMGEIILAVERRLRRKNVAANKVKSKKGGKKKGGNKKKGGKDGKKKGGKEGKKKGGKGGKKK